MRELKNCTRNEITKILAQRKYKLLPILIGILVAGSVLIKLISGDTLYGSMDNYPFSIMSILSYFVLPVLAFMIASDIIAGEEERNELKIALLHPVNRGSILAGKLIAIVLYLAVFLLGMAILAVAVSLPFTGLHVSLLAQVFMAVLLAMMPVIMISALSVLVSTFTKTSTASFILCLIAYAGIGLLGLLLPSLAMSLPTGYMAIYKMVLGSQIPWSSLGIGLAILGGYTILFASAAEMRFERKQA